MVKLLDYKAADNKFLLNHLLAFLSASQHSGAFYKLMFHVEHSVSIIYIVSRETFINEIAIT